MTSSHTNTELADSIMNYVSFLLSLIESQDWDQFEDVALSNTKTFKLVSRSISECKEFNGMTLLHACARFNAPINILKQMIELYPLALEGEDCVGRTPLHVASGSGASPWVLKLLVTHYPQACTIQDEDGRTPLHLACDTSCELFEDDCTPRDPPSLDTIKVLLTGSLSAVTLEDLDEMNAVEYAIISDASMDVVRLLQKASQRVMKKKIMKNQSPQISNQASAVMSRIKVRALNSTAA